MKKNYEERGSNTLMCDAAPSCTEHKRSLAGLVVNINPFSVYACINMFNGVVKW